MEKQIINSIGISDIKDDDLYVTDNSNNELDDSSYNLTSSWADIIIEEKSDSCECKQLPGSLKLDDSLPSNSKSTTTMLKNSCDQELDLSQISTINKMNLDDQTLIKYEVCITNLMRKNIKNNMDDMLLKDFSEKILWLIDASSILSSRNNLPLIQHSNDKNNSIARSSYKFCNYNYECEFNYNKKKFNGCYAQHYVHNMVWADLCSLNEFINNNGVDKNVIEIKKSINTISYVLNHMLEEINNANIYNLYKSNKDNDNQNKNNKNMKNKKKKNHKHEHYQDSKVNYINY